MNVIQDKIRGFVDYYSKNTMNCFPIRDSKLCEDRRNVNFAQKVTVVEDSSLMSLWANGRIMQAHRAVTRLLDSQKDEGWPSSLQFRLDVLALEALSKGKVKLIDLLPSLKEMRLQGKKTAGDFDEYFQVFQNKRRVAASKTIIPPQMWRFLFPLNLSFEGGLQESRCIHLLGKKFCFRSWHGVVEEIGPENFQVALTRVTDTARPKLTDTCVEVVAPGLDSRAAWNDLEPSFDALRGLSEWTLGLGSMKYSYPQGPRRQIPHPLWCMFWVQGNQPEWIRFYVHEAYKEDQPYEITQKEYQDFEKNAASFSGCPESGSLDELLVDCLRLYSQAMDASRNHECFVGLWQLAESITQVNRHQGDKKKLCSRLSFFGRFWESIDIECLKDALEWLYEKRNEIVHRGLHKRIEDDDVNILKLCCDAGLVWLSGQRNKLTTTNHLDFFFTWIDQSESHLATMEETLSQVKAHRLLGKKTGDKKGRQAEDYGKPEISPGASARVSPSELRKMPREQRQAILAAAAEMAEEDYRSDSDLTGFDAFSEEERDDEDESGSP